MKVDIPLNKETKPSFHMIIFNSQKQSKNIQKS